MFRKFKCLKKVVTPNIAIQVGDIVEVTRIQIVNNMPIFDMVFCDETKSICGYMFSITLNQLMEGIRV